MIRVFLVDDHAIVRDGLRSVLAAEPLLKVVGDAANGQELLNQLPAVATDVVLMDLNMPVLDGLATTRELHKLHPHLRILILSMMAHEHTIGELLGAGAHGYVLKNADKMEIVTAIEAVAAGKRFLCSEMGLADGLTNQQIADKIFTSRRTIEAHRQSLLEKTGATNTPALIKHAMEQGWLKQEGGSQRL
jgi:DNA-binding NarL/FixJ family response regulator